jgi:hypothetical protein
VIGEKGPKLVGSMGQAQEDVGNETGLFLYRQNAVADIFGQIVERGDGITADRAGPGGFLVECRPV